LPVNIYRSSKPGEGMNDLIDQCRRYWISAGRKELAHYLAAAGDFGRDKWIGIANVVLAAIVATSVFGSVSDAAVTLKAKLIVGGIAALATIAAALQTKLDYAEKATKHLAAAARFGKSRHALDILLLKIRATAAIPRDDALKQLTKISQELSAADTETPSITLKEYQQGQREFDLTHPNLP
jgi:hypothetical protein